MEPQSVSIRGDMILLQSLLKLVGEVGNGGEVRDYLAGRTLLVNGELEERRGRKLRDGDLVTLPGGQVLRIVAEPS